MTQQQSAKATTRPGTGIHDLFAERVLLAPDALAVRCGARLLTYGELDRLAEQVAGRLRSAGMPPGAPVAVCLDRGVDLLAALLGVLKAGGAYLPLDPAAPEHLLRHVLADAGPWAVLTVEQHRALPAGTPAARTICLDAPDGQAPGGPGLRTTGSLRRVGAPPAGGQHLPSGLACILYTAGGRPGAEPRGILVTHAALVRACGEWQQAYGLTPEDRHLQTAVPDAAGFTADLVRALCTGGTLVLAEESDPGHRPMDGAALYAQLSRERVTVLECDPATAMGLGRHLREQALGPGVLRLLSVAGEVWYPDEQQELRRVLGPGVRLLNTYTLTETVGDAARFEVPAESDTVPRPNPDGTPAGLGTPAMPSAPEQVPWPTSPLGRPVPGLDVAVLDRAGDPVGPGRLGEIAVGGPGVADGLHGPRSGSDRLLRTGDLGLLRADGTLEYAGRVGGHGDAEAVLRGHPWVAECLVAEVAGADGLELAAYTVPAEGRAVARAGLPEYASRVLPPDRVPDRIVPVASLPRTRRGAFDRGGLPLPAPSGSAGGPSGGKGAGKPGGNGKGRTAVRGQAGSRAVGLLLLGAVCFAVLAAALTGIFWRRSIDLTGVPQPWAFLFFCLYCCEWLAFGLGVSFLLGGRALLARRGRSAGPARTAHLAIVWLLASWWPQDTCYRLASKTDWPRQAALVYLFNVPLMIAAVLVAGYWTVSVGRNPAGRRQ